MDIKKKTKILIGIAAIVCLSAAAISIAIPNKTTNYEIALPADFPEYKTDTARAIDSYEGIINYYRDLTDKLFVQMDDQNLSLKIISIDEKLSDISTRLCRIEKALGIDPNNTGSKGSKIFKPK